MTPKEFLEGLLRHHGKRHASDADEIAWHREMREVIGNPRADVLRKAYEIIRDEHEERAFPLPATIKKAIAKAAHEVAPSSATMSEIEAEKYRLIASNRRAPDTPDVLAKARHAAEWQKAQMDKYGDWAAYHRANPPAAKSNRGPAKSLAQIAREMGLEDEA